MTKFESYLKERNIPIDSLEANSIQEGIEYAINEARQWMENQVYQDYPEAILSGIKYVIDNLI